MSRLEQLLTFFESSPTDSFIQFALAKEYEGSGNHEKALEHYKNLESNDPGYIGTYYHLGKLYEKKDDLQHAFSTYKKGMEIARKAGDQHAYKELAEAKLALGDEEDYE